MPIRFKIVFYYNTKAGFYRLLYLWKVRSVSLRIELETTLRLCVRQFQKEAGIPE